MCLGPVYYDFYWIFLSVNYYCNHSEYRILFTLTHGLAAVSILHVYEDSGSAKRASKDVAVTAIYGASSAIQVEHTAATLDLPTENLSKSETMSVTVKNEDQLDHSSQPGQPVTDTLLKLPHHAISIPEILSLIFSYAAFNSASSGYWSRISQFTSYACVCKSWMNPALDELWKDLDDPFMAFQLLAPLEMDHTSWSTVRSHFISSISVLCELVIS